MRSGRPVPSSEGRAPIDAEDFGVTGTSTRGVVDGLTKTIGSPLVITLFTVTDFRRHTARLPTIRTRAAAAASHGRHTSIDGVGCAVASRSSKALRSCCSILVALSGGILASAASVSIILL